MTVRDLYNLGDSALNQKAAYIAATVAASPADFGLSPAQAASMSVAASEFAVAIAELEAARAQLEVALAQKREAREATLSALSSGLNLMYATPGVQTEAIVSLSLSPRPSRHRRVTPQTPKGVVVKPFANGTATLAWERNGNPQGVVFLIESASEDAPNWTQIAVTTKTRITLEGVTPGVPRAFRVRATKNGDTSLPTFASWVYATLQARESQHAA